MELVFRCPGISYKIGGEFDLRIWKSELECMFKWTIVSPAVLYKRTLTSVNQSPFQTPSIQRRAFLPTSNFQPPQRR